MKSLNALLVPLVAMSLNGPWAGIANLLTSAKKRSAVGTRLRGPNPNPKTASLHYALRIMQIYLQ